MDWILFIGLMLGGAFFVTVMTVLTRLEVLPPRMPPWLLIGVLVGALILVASILASRWLNAVTAVLLLATFTMLFAVARRAPE